MNYVTIGRNYPEGKIVPVKCIKDDKFNNLHIKDECFLLVVLFEGQMSFSVGEKTVAASAPAFICFDENENPKLTYKKKCKSISLYFHPKFLNINMRFELIRSNSYDDIASVHDMFLLKPFVNGCTVIPIVESYMESLKSACDSMVRELSEQRDWYWTCRSRSYFMEVIITLERMHCLMQAGELSMAYSVKNLKLKDAVLFIEGHYFSDLTLDDIVLGCSINHTTLTELFRSEFGMTAMEYLMRHRISIAKKKLSFTFVPIKDISAQCGFKTVQHFSRVFKKYTNETPASYRNRTFEKRVAELG